MIYKPLVQEVIVALQAGTGHKERTVRGSMVEPAAEKMSSMVNYKDTVSTCPLFRRCCGLRVLETYRRGSRRKDASPYRR